MSFAQFLLNAENEKHFASVCKSIWKEGFTWWARRDSNPGPPACEAGALTS